MENTEEGEMLPDAGFDFFDPTTGKQVAVGVIAHRLICD